MVEIFVVDGCLHIHSVEVDEFEWERGGCVGYIKDQPIVINMGGWNKLTTYAGFETRKKAEQFKTTMKKQQPAPKKRFMPMR